LQFALNLLETHTTHTHTHTHNEKRCLNAKN
jgi:hypothetical protein